jgi:hypothetical protein
MAPAPLPKSVSHTGSNRRRFRLRFACAFLPKSVAPVRKFTAGKLAMDRSSRYGWGMKTNWPWWKWLLIVGGVLVAVSFLGALFLALSGMSKAWITVALAGALLVIVVLQLRRYLPKA